jgi:hypothetical protein
LPQVGVCLLCSAGEALQAEIRNGTLRRQDVFVSDAM